MCIYLAIVYAANTMFNEIGFLNAITFYHFTHRTKRNNICVRFSFEVKELVAVIFVLLSSLFYLLFQVFNTFRERIEDTYNMALLGKGGNGHTD